MKTSKLPFMLLSVGLVALFLLSIWGVDLLAKFTPDPAWELPLTVVMVLGIAGWVAVLQWPRIVATCQPWFSRFTAPKVVNRKPKVSPSRKPAG